MIRNQLFAKYPSNLSGGVMFLVEDNSITAETQTTANRGDTIVLHKDPSLMASVTHVCAQLNDACQCSTLVEGVSSGNHMALGGTYTEYKIATTAAVDADYELYPVTDEGPVESATNGDVHIGG